MPDDGMTTVTAADLTALATWIEDALGDETVRRQQIAETTAARLRDLIQRMSGADVCEISGQDDDLQPYCVTCGEWCGLFIGMAGWHHYHGDPEPGGRRTLYTAGHEAVIGWAVPPGRPLSPAGVKTLAQALADAITHREPAAHPAGQCEGHARGLARADAYRAVARDLGIGPAEVGLVNDGELGRLRREVRGSGKVADDIALALEIRVTAIEEVLAARWPRRWLLSARLRRAIRASVRGFPGETFAERRFEATATAGLADLIQQAQNTEGDSR